MFKRVNNYLYLVVVPVIPFSFGMSQTINSMFLDFSKIDVWSTAFFIVGALLFVTWHLFGYIYFDLFIISSVSFKMNVLSSILLSIIFVVLGIVMISSGIDKLSLPGLSHFVVGMILLTHSILLYALYRMKTQKN